MPSSIPGLDITVLSRVPGNQAVSVAPVTAFQNRNVPKFPSEDPSS